MLLKDFTMFFIDLNFFFILLGLFIWFTFLTLNFLFFNSLKTSYKIYIYKFVSINL